MAATDGLLVFVDESGYAQPRDASPWNTLVAIGLPESASELSEVATAASRDFPVRGETYYGLYTMPARYYANPPHPREF